METVFSDDSWVGIRVSRIDLKLGGSPGDHYGFLETLQSSDSASGSLSFNKLLLRGRHMLLSTNEIHVSEAC